MTKSHPKFMLTTFGCQMNQADSQRLRGLLAKIGYAETETEEDADLILFNTCCVRQHAEQRLIGRIQSLINHKKRNANLIIGVSGCMAQNMQAEMLEALPLVDLVFGPNDIEELPLLLQKAANGKTLGSFVSKGSFDGDTADGIILSRPFSAMVNIIRGCTNFCSYCIVPYVRGPEVSRPMPELKAYISDLAASGVTEITLLGQNVNAYGRDIGLEEGFTQLLEMIEEIDGIRWVRFMTSHPRDFSLAAIKRIARLRKVCEQYHLPVQSGSNHVLELMKRGYSREKYLALVDAVREHISNACLSTDIICGFPGESAEDFNDTLELVAKVRYESAFMYYYSPRPGTEAAKMADQLSEEEKKDRLARLIELQNSISLEESRKLVGRDYEVLVESAAARDKNDLVGKIRSGRSVNFSGDKSLIGRYVRVRIEQARNWTLSGKLLPPEGA
ncbi:MAG: tRNA (N6-isopentenyl adenosine(37)-C2)-methylthiotransferase MiaB [Candidatus Riflebacteria bacterium HGW-Riflebacteria-2]|jgi:tRNA-2-methylthio-N6-dimethylallyladenosine synthase|nr:MAG: tRNA (N6-isopentenyl adenosine(37)-C2)-methylthiotransferase MiaB [Candidatus Riflebacteria bacterium HGW-Riflebacteria-2]